MSKMSRLPKWWIFRTLATMPRMSRLFANDGNERKKIAIFIVNVGYNFSSILAIPPPVYCPGKNQHNYPIRCLGRLTCIWEEGGFVGRNWGPSPNSFWQATRLYMYVIGSRMGEVDVTGKSLETAHTIELNSENCLSTGPRGWQSPSWRCDLVSSV